MEPEERKQFIAMTNALCRLVQTKGDIGCLIVDTLQDEGVSLATEIKIKNRYSNGGEWKWKDARFVK
jgi:stress response protein SCP2